jgi:hypothetical protein
VCGGEGGREKAREIEKDRESERDREPTSTQMATRADAHFHANGSNCREKRSGAYREGRAPEGPGPRSAQVLLAPLAQMMSMCVCGIVCMGEREGGRERDRERERQRERARETKSPPPRKWLQEQTPTFTQMALNVERKDRGHTGREALQKVQAHARRRCCSLPSPRLAVCHDLPPSSDTCSGYRMQGSGFRVQGAGFRVQGSGFRVQGSGFRV